MSVRVCGCFSVCVTVTIVRTGQTLAKIRKCVYAKIVLSDLEILLEGQQLKKLVSLKR